MCCHVAKTIAKNFQSEVSKIIFLDHSIELTGNKITTGFYGIHV